MIPNTAAEVVRLYVGELSSKPGASQTLVDLCQDFVERFN